MSLVGVGKWGAFAATIALTAPVPSSAQSLDRLSLLQKAVVRVHSDRNSGSGLVVASDPGVLAVITARHVVEGSGPRPLGSQQSRRPCDLRPLVTYQFQSQMSHEASSATCSDDVDLALLEVPIPPSLENEFPQFQKAVPLGDVPLSQVIFLGAPLGQPWGRRAGSVLTNDTAPDGTSGEVVLQGTDAEPGFSGGAVLDASFGLIGMIVRTAKRTTVAVHWSRIERTLSEWKVTTNRMAGAVTGPSNPAFRAGRPPDFREEGARNAVRRFQSAFAGQRADALGIVYPTLSRSTISALFGDAFQIELSLRDCTDIGGDNTISCEFKRTIYRRTGETQLVQSACFDSSAAVDCRAALSPARANVSRMTFHLSPGEQQWMIDRID